MWNFGEREADAFHWLKEAFNSALVLCHWAPDLPMTIEMDPSDFTIASILLVSTPDDKICPVAFLSHSLQPAKCNYNTHNKELLAIFEAYKSWCHYLKGSTNVINMVTNHKNLEYFTTTKKLTCQQACWSKFLSQFNLKIHFCPRRLGTKPDALSQFGMSALKGGIAMPQPPTSALSSPLTNSPSPPYLP